MNYAIIELGGRQVIVEEGVHFLTNNLHFSKGTQISLNRLLLSTKTGLSDFGQPYLANGSVISEVLEHIRGPKMVIYKMKSKKKYRRKHGHRQSLTRLLVKVIQA